MINTFNFQVVRPDPKFSANAPRKKIIISESTKLKDLLQDASIVQTYKNNCQVLNDFFIKNVNELLQLAFEDNNSVVTISAFRILTFPYYFLITALISKAHFENYASSLLYQNHLSNRIIGRICSITRTIFSFGDVNACKHCSYISIIINYGYNSSVVNLFSSLFAKDEEMEHVQNCLIENGLIGCIEYKINSILNLSKIENFSEESETLINLVRILAVIFKNCQLATEKSLFYSLFDKIPSNVPQTAVNYIWETLNMLFTKSNAIKLCKFANEARENLISPTQTISQYHSECVAFLTKCMEFRSDLIDNELIKAILGLFLQFTHCSFFMAEAKRFFVESTKVDILLCRVLKYVAPVLIVEASIKDHELVPYFSLSIMESLASNPNARKIILKLDNGKEFLEKTLPDYIKFRDSSYGADDDSFSIWSIFSMF